MPTRLAAPLVLLVAAALLIAGCGGGDAEQTTPAGTTTAQQQETTTAKGTTSKQEGNGSQSQSEGEGDQPAPTYEVTVSDAAVSGSEKAAPGVPTSRNGDNSIQLWGTEGTDEDRRQAADALAGFLSARAALDNALMCAYVSPKLISDLTRQLAGGQKVGCPQLLSAAVNPDADRSRLRAEAQGNEVLSFRVDSDEQGFVIYRDSGGKIWAYPMNRGADGAWKLSLLGPTPIS